MGCTQLVMCTDHTVVADRWPFSLKVSVYYFLLIEIKFSCRSSYCKIYSLGFIQSPYAFPQRSFKSMCLKEAVFFFFFQLCYLALGQVYTLFFLTIFANINGIISFYVQWSNKEKPVVRVYISKSDSLK